MSIDGRAGPRFDPGEYCGWRDEEDAGRVDPGSGAALYVDGVG